MHPRLNSTNNKKNNNSSNGVISNKSSRNSGKQQKQLQEIPKIIKKQKFSKTFGRNDDNIKSYFKLMSEEEDDFDEEDKKDDVIEEESDEDDDLGRKSVQNLNGSGTNRRKQWANSTATSSTNITNVLIF